MTGLEFADAVIGSAREASLRNLYESAFPPEERRPWQKIIHPGIAGCPTLLAIVDNGKDAGMATIWNFKDFLYIEHLAVDNSLRGKGIGSGVLEKLKNKDLPIVVEVEKPTDNLTRRRIDFYRRNGFRTISTSYVQPPYALGLRPVPLNLMSTHEIDPWQVEETLHRQVYGR